MKKGTRGLGNRRPWNAANPPAQKAHQRTAVPRGVVQPKADHTVPNGGNSRRGAIRSTAWLLGLNAAILLGLLVLPVLPAFASGGNCLQTEYNVAVGKSTKLTCTANDVRVAFADKARDLNGNPITKCNAGQPLNFVADFHVVTTATARENIGLYFNTGGDGNALTGTTCVDNIISPQHPTAAQCTGAGTPYTCCTGVGVGPTCGCFTGAGQTPQCLGSSHYEEFETSPDNCGDTSSSDLNGGEQVITAEVDGALCQTNAAGNDQCTGAAAPYPCCTGAGTGTCLALPNCTSWQQPGGTIQCASPSPNYPYPFDINGKPQAVPGSTSKCSCDNKFVVGIQVQTPGVSVTKNCTNANGNAGTLPTPQCTLGAEGGSETYKVDISNQSNFGSINIDQICDSAYGTVFRASTYTGSACTPGTTASITGTNCNTLTTIAQGSDQFCNFTVNQGENQTVTDIVNVVGHGISATFGPTASNSAMVSSTDAASTATTTETLVNTNNGCVIVRYGVDVANGSSADEVLSLSALNSAKYGSITSVQGNVLGTTCGVASGAYGLGTMGSKALNPLPSSAGTLPASLAVGGPDYSCQFDAQYCGAIGSITPPGGSPCSGLIVPADKVTASLTGDEGETVTQTQNSLTIYECLTQYPSTSP